MFATSVAAPQRPGRFFRVTIAVSIGLHVAAIVGFTLASFWKITRLTPKGQELVFQPLASPSPPAEPAAAPATPEKSTIRKAPDDTPRQPGPTTEPVEPVAEVAPEAPAPRDTAGPVGDGPVDGDPNSLGHGNENIGTVGSPDIGVGLPAAPPEPVKPPAPEQVTRQEAEGHRIVGDPQIRLPDAVLASLSGQGLEKLTVQVRLCIDERGAPVTVRFTPPSGYDRVDETIRARMATWRYRPWTVNGQPMRACFPVVFKYRITP